MAITLRQKNAAITASGTTGTCPAWSLSPVAGNLLLIVINETNGFTGSWSGTPAGYTAVSPTPNVYHTSFTSPNGIYWKIATGGDATPAAIGADSGSAGPWAVYTYEFVSPGGWATSAKDASVGSVSSNTSATTKASGTTATLAQANELAIAICTMEAAGTLLTFSNGFTNDQPTGAVGYHWFAWQETAATTALSTTASWTTAQIAGCRIATFKTLAAAAAAFAPQTVKGAAMASFMKARYEGAKSSTIGLFDSAGSSFGNWAPSPMVERATPLYRARGSLNISAADEAIPSGDFSSPASSRYTPFYRGSGSLVMNAADEAIPNQDYAIAATSRQVPAYAAGRAQVMSVYDQPAGASPPALAAVASRDVAAYAGGATVFAGAADAIIADPWAPTILSALRELAPARSSITFVADNPAAVPADTFAAVILTRAVALYESPPARVTTVYDQPAVVADSFAAVVLGRIATFYDPPATRAVSVYDQATVGIAIVAQSTRSRITVARSLVVLPGASPIVAPDSWVPGALARQVQVTRLASSSFAGAADQIVAYPYAFTLKSRQVPFYRQPGSLVMNVADEPILGGVQWMRVFKNRRVLPYGPFLSRVFNALWSIPPEPPPPPPPFVPPVGTVVYPNQGGGGEWIIWGAPDFPGNRPGAFPRFPRPDFRRPSRREKRGY